MPRKSKVSKKKNNVKQKQKQKQSINININSNNKKANAQLGADGRLLLSKLLLNLYINFRVWYGVSKIKFEIRSR